MESVDHIILQLRQNEAMTAKDLARAVQLKPISVRYHLTNLMASGDVHRVHVVHTGRSGRPAYIYKLTARGRNRAARIAQAVSDRLVRTA